MECTGQVQDRSDAASLDGRLTTRMGCRSVSELVQRATLASKLTVAGYERAARGVHEQVAPSSGEKLPAAFPGMRAALIDGAVGVDGVVAVLAPLVPSGRRPRDVPRIWPRTRSWRRPRGGWGWMRAPPATRGGAAGVRAGVGGVPGSGRHRTPRRRRDAQTRGHPGGGPGRGDPVPREPAPRGRRPTAADLRLPTQPQTRRPPLHPHRHPGRRHAPARRDEAAPGSSRRTGCGELGLRVEVDAGGCCGIRRICAPGRRSSTTPWPPR